MRAFCHPIACRVVLPADTAMPDSALSAPDLRGCESPCFIG